MSEEGLQTLLCLGVALTAGFVIGAEREQGSSASFGGVRTYPVIALLGAFGALLHPLLLVALALGVSVLVAIAYYRDSGDSEEHGLSSETAALATFALGALAASRGLPLPEPDRLLLVGAGATTVLGLLALKRRLHDFVARVSKDDVLATTKLMLLAIVLLPLLPNQDLGPFGALNPRSIGLLVVLISAIGFAGYVAVRVFGARKGLGLTGLLGGLASSTAVTLTFAGRAKASPSLVNGCAVAIVLASSTMFPRLAAELAAVSPALAGRALYPLGAAALAGFGAGLFLYLRLSAETREEAKGDEPALELENPFTLRSALKFAALFTAVLLVSRAASHYFADTGVLLSAVVTGLADADAISLSVARLQVGGAVSMDTAVLAVGLSAGANTVSKIAIALVLGGRGLALRVGAALGAALAVGGLAALLSS